MVMVSKQDLLDLPLCVPPMEVQKQVVEVADLLEKEKTLCSSILEKRNQLISARLAQIVSEA
jgi:restriction endonuclease S subunit